MAKRDHYDVLGVSRDTGDAEIKKSYRRLAMKLHPDRNPNDAGAEDKFKEAKEAYEVLSDRQKRAAYDRFGHAGVDASGAGAGFHDIFDKFFDDIIGGRDPDFKIELDLEEAINGKTVHLNFPTQIACQRCSGSGAAPGTSPLLCTTCAGQGRVRVQQGFFSIQQTCPRCHGKGNVITKPCSDCRGHGRVHHEKILPVTIPPGVDTGRFQVRGEGSDSAGDLYVLNIQVRTHPIFTRKGLNLHCEAPIGFSMAALGGELEVPTLGGRVNLKIPPETQTDRTFRLRGKGVRSVRSSGPGDLICRIIVETPVNLNKRQKELLREFGEEVRDSHKTHDPKATSWFDSVKEFFEGLKI